MNHSELQKLYPDFRIPYEKEADYYLHVLLRNNSKLQKQFDDFTALESEQSDIIKYKFKKFDEIMEYFKSQNWDLNSIDKDSPLLHSGYSEQDFNNYRPDKFYISIDLKEANWQAFIHGLSLSKALDYERWSNFCFSLHPAIARSKSFRQFLFGNTNPKRLQSIQKSMMNEFYNCLSDEWKSFIVGKKSDEILFELPNDWRNYDSDDFGEALNMLPYKFKVTLFRVSEYTNFNEFVRIKEVYSVSSDIDTPHMITERKLMGVPGNRFFIHYKTLILGESLDERDTFFINDKHLAKWTL